MTKNFKNKGTYSEVQEKFLQYIKDNKKIEINNIDESTIKEVDNYIKNLKDISKDILEESTKKRIKDIELDLSLYVGSTVSIASLQVAVIPMFLKYFKIPVVLNVAKCIEVLLAILMVVLISQINSFYFRRKREVLFNNFLLSRISKIQFVTNKKNRT
ncbi:hypothetical protein [Clostridium polynesiense]|uniref:hypothetical protein n=1 Tax=Clostridium polynesiense TaxID=1325933 RepID=UPI00058CE60E|nr:hypothetical protein [Clostridium polynesiense]